MPKLDYKEILDDEKWYPIMRVTNYEYWLSKGQNDLLDALKHIDEDKIPDALNSLKLTLINVALKLNIKL